MLDAFKDPTRTLLFSGIVVAAVLAGAGFFLFFANVPEPGAAREQILESSPQMARADVDRIIAARNAYAPKPSRAAKAELADLAEADGPLATAGFAVESPAASAIAAAPVAADPRPLQALGNEGDALLRAGDIEEAIAWWETDAARGGRWSAYRLGVLYLDGDPERVRRDVAAGLRWLRVAADLNEPRAQFELGTLYEAGIGVPADPAAAASWYLRAADRGLAAGQYNIATMLEGGIGVESDKVEALKFYTLAARQGFTTAPEEGSGAGRRRSGDPASALLDLRSRLGPDAIREAEARAAAFKPIRD